MGSTTFSDMKTRLKLRFGNSDSWDSYYGTWCNSAYGQLVNRDKITPDDRKRLYFPELITSTSSSTSDGTAYVSTPSDCLVVYEVFDDTSNVRLDWIPFRDYLAKTDRDTTTAEDSPEKWTRSGSYIYVYPTPDSTYSLTIYYRKRPTALSADADVTAIGAEWDDVILELAYSIGRMWAGEIEKSEYSMKLAEKMMSQISGLYDAEEKARREKIRPEASTLDRGSTY
ncbi:MAG: hypothetical protein M0R06_02590 [Sphaerochaeta sp.]|jgi:hypothetical protein|nr:hypothetical protein [Sphaerochaeta sp.]